MERQIAYLGTDLHKDTIGSVPMLRFQKTIVDDNSTI